MSIRDTSAQDRTLTGNPGGGARRRRLAAIAAGVGLLLLAGWLVSAWSAGARSHDASRLRIAEVVRGDLVRDIAAEGRVIAANNPTLYAVAAGTVTLSVVAGDQVGQGDALAVIDSPELRSRLAQEQATLASLEAEAGRASLDAQVARSAARRTLDQAGIDHQAAIRDLERNRHAFEGGAVAAIDVARAEDDLHKTELALAHARREYELEGQGATLDQRNKQLVADRQRAVVEELQRQVDALTLRSPFDGQVGQVLVEQHQHVAADTPVLGVVDLTRFEVEIRVPESFARDLAPGMPAELSGAGSSWPAEVSSISPQVVNGEVIGRLRFAGEQPPGLRQNQRMRARILLDTRDDVLMVERGPFLEQGGGNHAWVVEDGVATRRSIRTGASSLGAVEILDGLEPGDRVIVAGADQFGSNEQVRISGD